MNGTELKTTLRELGVSQRWFADYVGRSFSVVNRWATDLIPVPRYAELAIENLRREKGS